MTDVNYHEGLYRKVLGINQTSKTRPLVIFPTTNKVTIKCHDRILFESSRIDFDNMTVNEIVATWDNENGDSKEDSKEDSNESTGSQ